MLLTLNKDECNRTSIDANSASSPVILDSPSVSFTNSHVRTLIKPMAACCKTKWTIYRYSGVGNTRTNCHPAHMVMLPYESYLCVTQGPTRSLWLQHHDNLIAHPPLGEIHHHWQWSVMCWNECVMKSSVWTPPSFPCCMLMVCVGWWVWVDKEWAQQIG